VEIELTNGNATADGQIIRLGAADAEDVVYDKVKVSTSEIGDNP
jgi:hypothetical protein